MYIVLGRFLVLFICLVLCCVSTGCTDTEHHADGVHVYEYPGMTSFCEKPVFKDEMRGDVHYHIASCSN